MTLGGLPVPVQIAVSFTRVLEELGVPYVIGGSFASSVHGAPRTTNDVDVVCDIRPEHVDRLASALGREYYMSKDAAREAIRARGSFNLIHVETAVKVDVFVAGTDPLNAEGLRARVRVQVSSEPEAWLYVNTPEHTILHKLAWYRRGGEASDRQWRDVLTMLRVQGSRLDQRVLDEWAPRLKVADLLERARAEAR